MALAARLFQSALDIAGASIIGSNECVAKSRTSEFLVFFNCTMASAAT
jgi:hypothetical protein